MKNFFQKGSRAGFHWLSPKKKEKNFSALASEKALAKDWLSKEEENAWKNL